MSVRSESKAGASGNQEKELPDAGCVRMKKNGRQYCTLPAIFVVRSSDDICNRMRIDLFDDFLVYLLVEIEAQYDGE
jgi:hypothetical protein